MKLITAFHSIFLLVLPAFAASFSPRSNPILPSQKISSTSLASKPFAIVVDAEIQPDRIDEFLDLIEKDAVGSRAEPGCLRFGKKFCSSSENIAIK